MATYDLDTIRTNYQDFSDWFELQSVSRAKTFITWATRLIEAAPSSAAQAANSAGFRVDLVERQIQKACDFVDRFDTGAASLRGPNVTRTSFRTFRGFGI